MAVIWKCPDCPEEVKATGYGVVGERIFVDKIRTHERTHESDADQDDEKELI